MKVNVIHHLANFITADDTHHPSLELEPDGHSWVLFPLEILDSKHHTFELIFEATRQLLWGQVEIPRALSAAEVVRSWYTPQFQLFGEWNAENSKMDVVISIRGTSINKQLSLSLTHLHAILTHLSIGLPHHYKLNKPPRAATVLPSAIFGHTKKNAQNHMNLTHSKEHQQQSLVISQARICCKQTQSQTLASWWFLQPFQKYRTRQLGLTIFPKGVAFKK